MRRINRKTEKRNKLLDRLEEESWQLELIVSGVVIFLLLGAYDPMRSLLREVGVNSLGASRVTVAAMFMTGCLLFSYLLLIVMFLFHLALRGMWIGAIGLRSVSGDFDYEALDFQPKFKDFLSNRLGKFDDYIERLEKNASIAFSLAFLLFFAVLSLGLFFASITAGFIILTGGYSDSSSFASVWGKFAARAAIIVFVVWTILMLIGGLLYLIDFITFGWLKKRKWFHKAYYPIYRFLGWVTLAHLYRPFYYNIIDDPFGKRLVRVYTLLAFLGIMATAFVFHPFPNFAYDNRQAGVVNAGSYADADRKLVRSQRNLRFPSLGSRFADRDYLEIFVPHHSGKHSKILRHRFPELRPLTPSAFAFVDEDVEYEGRAIQIDSTLRALSAIHRVYLNDSLLTNVQWKFYRHPVREQPGLLYDLPVYDLPRGEHRLRIEDQFTHGDSTCWKPWIELPFLR